jgi:hypothetical protein
MLDVFKSDVYGVTSLTAAVNKLPFVPSRLGQLGLFKKKGVITTSVVVEEQRGKLFIVPTAARGTTPNVFGGKKRQARAFIAPHIPLIGAVYADDVQNVREFGSETAEQTVASLVNDKLSDMRQAIETTIEWHRVCALNGILLDADGSTVIYNWFTEFGITPPSVVINWTTNGLHAVAFAANTIRRTIEDALGMDTYRNIRCIVGSTLFDQITSSQEVNHAYYRQLDSSFLRESHVRGEFDYKGITWEEYRGKIGQSINGDGSFFATNNAIAFPEGTSDIFIESYSPANFMETVNTMGKPLYAKQQLMDWDLGVEIQVQSNPLVMCTRPGVLCSVTATGTPTMISTNESLGEMGP